MIAFDAITTAPVNHSRHLYQLVFIYLEVLPSVSKGRNAMSSSLKQLAHNFSRWTSDGYTDVLKCCHKFPLILH